jgi:hypothetical protein
MNKISAHQRLIRLTLFIFLHDTDPILRQKITLRFACQLGFKAMEHPSAGETTDRH